MQTSGFMYIINHGMTQAEVRKAMSGHATAAKTWTQNDRIFDIADIPFSQVPEEEMKRYVSDIKATGSYRGFKPRRIWVSAVRIVGGRTLKVL